MQSGKKIYFASDFHLGVPDYESSREREDRVVRWLNEISKDAEEIFLVGDLFDFWFEYKHAVPRGYIRVLGKLAEIADSGVKISMFTGNHDMWIFDYLPKEIGCDLFRKPIEREFNGKKFLIGHGDGLGPGDRGYKFIKKVFASKVCQWLFARLHPNFGIGLANFFSKRSRKMTGEADEQYFGDKEWLVIYSNQVLEKKKIDYFVFGHRHFPMEITLKNEHSKYINLGEWIKYNTYAVFDGNIMQIKAFETELKIVRSPE
ncbi:MAG: UDP-2,3-diacylglucosamine diphosphatase [Crocinitomicaceae bacterium]